MARWVTRGEVPERARLFCFKKFQMNWQELKSVWRRGSEYLRIRRIVLSEFGFSPLTIWRKRWEVRLHINLLTFLSKNRILSEPSARTPQRSVAIPSEELTPPKKGTLKAGVEFENFWLLGAENLETGHGVGRALLGLPLNEPPITDEPTGASGTAERKGGDGESKGGL